LVLGLADRRDQVVLVLSTEANVRMPAIDRDIEPRLAAAGSWAHIIDWDSKYASAIARIAGLLHLAEGSTGGPIDAGTFDRAATIGAYFADHALAAFDDTGADPLVDDARHVLSWIERTQTERLTKPDLFSALSRGRFRKAGDLAPVLKPLVGHGYLATAPTPERRGAGRTSSPAWLVHPGILRPAGTVRPISVGRAS
jgi:replicative DNA helicase